MTFFMSHRIYVHGITQTPQDDSTLPKVTEKDTKKIQSSFCHQIFALTMTESKPFTGVNLLLGSYFFLFIAGELTLEERRERDRRTPRVALRRHRHSSFRYLFDSGDNQALLNCCGTTHEVFQELLALFKPYFDRLTFDDDGRVRKVKLSRHGKRILSNCQPLHAFHQLGCWQCLAWLLLTFEFEKK